MLHCPLRKPLKLVVLVLSSTPRTWLSFRGAQKLRLWNLSQYSLRKEWEEKSCEMSNLVCQGGVGVKSEWHELPLQTVGRNRITQAALLMVGDLLNCLLEDQFFHSLKARERLELWIGTLCLKLEKESSASSIAETLSKLIVCLC